MLILVSENGEVACMDTTLHRLQRFFFLYCKSVPGILGFPMFHFTHIWILFPIASFYHAFCW